MYNPNRPHKRYIAELTDKTPYFDDPDYAQDLLIHLRWPDPEGITCPYFPEHDPNDIVPISRAGDTLRWRCNECRRLKYMQEKEMAAEIAEIKSNLKELRKQIKSKGTTTEDKAYLKMKIREEDAKLIKENFSVRTNNMISGSKMPFNKYFALAFKQITDINGASSPRVGRATGTRQPVTWFSNHKLRIAMNDMNERADMSIPACFEVDDTGIGGEDRNRHEMDKTHPGGGVADKQSLLGFHNRNTGQYHVALVKAIDAATIKKVMTFFVPPNSIVITDKSSALNSIVEFGAGYRHISMNHKKKQYVLDKKSFLEEHDNDMQLWEEINGKATINTLEQFWRELKDSWGAIHKGRIDRKHLRKYAQALAYIWSTRHISTEDNMIFIMQTMLKTPQMSYEEMITIEDEGAKPKLLPKAVRDGLITPEGEYTQEGIEFLNNRREERRANRASEKHAQQS